MKCIIFTLSILIILLFPSYAQIHGQEKIDSLTAVLKSAKEDTSKVTILNAISNEYRNNDPEKAILFSNQALELSEKLNYNDGIAFSKLTLATALTNTGNVDEALKNCNRALEIFESLIDEINSGDKSKILLRISAALNLRGTIYMRKGNDPEALKNLFAALKIREAVGDEFAISYTENNLGIIYMNQNNFPEALTHFTKSLKIREKFNDKVGVAAAYNNIGVVYVRQQNYAEAIRNYNASLNISEEVKDKDGIASSYTNIGLVHEENGNFSEALKYHMQALEMAEQIGNKFSIALIAENIALVYMKLKQIAKAREYLQWALELNKETGSHEQLHLNYSNLAATDSMSGNYEQALQHYKLYIAYRDSLYNEENTKKLVQAQMQYDFDKKEALVKADQDKKDALNEKEMQKQKLVRNGFISGFAIVLLFASVFFTQRNKISKEKKRSEELLLNILPAEVAEELKLKGAADAKQFDHVTVMFTDFKGFTQISEKLTASQLVEEIHTCFKEFDAIVTKYNIEKIKTIGDSYMCAGGLPVINQTNAVDVVNAALEIQFFMQNYISKSLGQGKEPFEIRIGIHTGPVVAGIVGVKKFAYDIWGDTVNIASRMESSGETGKINISGSTFTLVKDKFIFTYRGKIQAKNKGEIDMYFVEGRLS